MSPAESWLLTLRLGIEPEHLLAAVIMTSPGTILIAKMLVPETGLPATEGRVVMPKDEVAKGRESHRRNRPGYDRRLHVAFNVATMLISFPALWRCSTACWDGRTRSPTCTGFPTLWSQIFGLLFRAGGLGDRRSLARLRRHWQPAGHAHGAERTRRLFHAWTRMKAALDPRSFTIATFALCGFANLSSIGIQIGGIGALAPNKKSELARLGIRAMLAGTMANLMSASIAGMLL